MTHDRSWTAFVRGWRDLTRTLFLPRCSRSEPCCEAKCQDVAEHFALTGVFPDDVMWRLFHGACWYCGAMNSSTCRCEEMNR